MHDAELLAIQSGLISAIFLFPEAAEIAQMAPNPAPKGRAAELDSEGGMGRWVGKGARNERLERRGKEAVKRDGEVGGAPGGARKQRASG